MECRDRRTDHLLVAGACVVAAALGEPAELSAQGWPSAGVVAAAGITSIDGKGSASFMAGLTRSWGPVVGSLIGDVSITSYKAGYPRASVDPLNVYVYCGDRRVNDQGAVCPATISAVGGAMAEVGVSLAPVAPVVISRGYRFGPVSEPYFAATVHGPTRKAPIRWIVRAAAGARTAQVHAGVVIDFELGFP